MSDVDDLRGRAEALVGGELRELHELRVHQVELQLQNEELRRMHLELSRSRARYFDLYDLAPVAYFSVSQHGQILDANHTASTVLGVPRSAVIARPFTQFIAPEDQDLYYLLRKRLDATGSPQSVELRLLRGDGTYFWAHIATTAATDEDGAHVARMAISDVSDRKRAEEARAETEERLGAVLDTAHEVIITVDAAGLVTEWNRQAETVFGWTHQEATGHHLSDLIMAERYRSEQQESLQLAVQGGHRSRHARHELHAVRKSGEELLMEFTVSAMPVRGAMFYSAFMTDLTKQRATEQAKLRLEAQLQQAQRLESVGRLAGGVAHDTNNMLGVIEGLAEIVADDVGPSHTSQRDLEQIREACERSAALTRQLMAFARQQPISPQVLDLSAQAAGVITMLSRLLGADASLHFVPAGELWSVTMDPSQFDQVLTNLCVNARDAITGIGTITVTLSNHRLDDQQCAAHVGAVPGEYVRVTVSDSGTGMDAATQALMFEPFFTTKAIGKGTGLGLATVYGVVLQNHGFIDVSSELGRGTDIHVYLPRSDGKVETEAKDRPGVAAQGGGETILLVEDEPALLRIVGRLLGNLGYHVLGAGSVEEAERICARKDQPIDLLMTDVIMPAMNGRELAAKLVAERPGLKRVFMSGYSADVLVFDPSTEEELIFLQKPFSPAALSAVVRRALDGGGAG